MIRNIKDIFEKQSCVPWHIKIFAIVVFFVALKYYKSPYNGASKIILTVTVAEQPG